MPHVLLVVVVLGALVALLSVPSFAHRKAGRRELLSFLVWRGVFVLGLLLGARRGLHVALSAGLGGAAACFVADWLFVALSEPFSTRGRGQSSLLQRLWWTRLPYGLGLCVAALGAVLYSGRREELGAVVIPALVAFGLALVALSLRRAMALVRELVELGSVAVAVEPLPPPRAAEVLEVGVGEGTSLVARRGSAPYRQGQLGDVLVRGAIGEGTAVALRVARRRVLPIGLVAMGLGVVLAAPSRRDPDLARLWSQRPPAAPKATPGPKDGPRPPDYRTYLSWYPQPGPIVEDLNGDGVEDVIGLRWDAGNQRAALHVVANDGKTMNELWRSEGFPAQWAGRSTFLLRHKAKLFMTEGEGNLRVFDPTTGSLTAFADLPLPVSLCGVHDDPRVFLQTAHYPADGWLVDPAGRREAATRPKQCDPIASIPSCDDAATSLCRPRKTPPFLAAERERGSVDLLEERGSGVAIRALQEFRASAEEPKIWGYDAKTRRRRYEVPTVFSGDVLHAKPGLNTELSAGRVFVYYQQRNGSWRLGARDAASGAVLWRIEPPRAEMGTTFMSMRATEARLYVALDNRLEVFDAATGRSVGVVW